MSSIGRANLMFDLEKNLWYNKEKRRLNKEMELKAPQMKIKVSGPAQEEILEERFVELFTAMCERSLPIIGFIIESDGGYMIGEKEVFTEIFKDYKTYYPQEFDFENYIKTADKSTHFWLAQLDPYDPMRSTLIKYV